MTGLQARGHDSHPNRWRYGGILVHGRHDGAPCHLRAEWCQRVIQVHPGDEVLLLRTPYGPQVAGVVARHA